MSDEYEEIFERWRQQCEQLQAKIQRLQTLQTEDVTPEELQAVNNETPGMVYSYTIAAVCRGMLREDKGND